MGLTSMLCKLRIAQDLFAELQAISVLLVLVTSLQQRQSRQEIRNLWHESMPSLPHSLRQPCEVHKEALADVLHVTVLKYKSSLPLRSKA